MYKKWDVLCLTVFDVVSGGDGGSTRKLGNMHSVKVKQAKKSCKMSPLKTVKYQISSFKIDESWTDDCCMFKDIFSFNHF